MSRLHLSVFVITMMLRTFSVMWFNFQYMQIYTCLIICLPNFANKCVNYVHNDSYAASELTFIENTGFISVVVLFLYAHIIVRC